MSTVGAELDRVEDELDAFVCAYIGLYHAVHGVPRSVVVGDISTGYIVVPVAGAQRDAPLHETAKALDGLTLA
jgi:predicted RNase H-like nuclease